MVSGLHPCLINGEPVLTVPGGPELPLRFTSDEPDDYVIRLSIVQRGSIAQAPVMSPLSAIAETTESSFWGWVRTAHDGRYFETSHVHHRRERLQGWRSGNPTTPTNGFPRRATLEAIRPALVSPWTMRLEHEPAALNRYDLAEAWHADYGRRAALHLARGTRRTGCAEPLARGTVPVECFDPKTGVSVAAIHLG